MTPKEKAIELYNKMYETGFKPKSVLIRIEQAKECALIAVGEMINVCYWNTTKEFLLEVKKEIEAL